MRAKVQRDNSGKVVDVQVQEKDKGLLDQIAAAVEVVRSKGGDKQVLHRLLKEAQTQGFTFEHESKTPDRMVIRIEGPSGLGYFWEMKRRPVQ